MVQWSHYCEPVELGQIPKHNIEMKKLTYIVASPTSMQSFILPRIGWLKEEYEVVCICSLGPEHEEARAQGLRTIELPIARHISPWQDLKSLWALYRVLRREKPDMVHSMTPKAGLLGMAAAWLAGVKVRMHTFTGLIFPWRKGLMHHILKMTDRITCFFATVVNPEGPGVKRQLEEAHITKKPLHIIGNGNINGVDPERFVPGKGREAKRGELGYTEKNVVFSFVGRLVKDKGIPELVDCFVRLHREHPEARLLLIGREEPNLDPLPEATRTTMLSHEAIHCAGSQVDVVPWLAASDIYVLPSHREGFCNSLLEAGAMALPCITYDICGCNDVVTRKTGILVALGEKNDLYESMQVLLEDRELRQRLGTAARRLVGEKFNRTAVWKSLKNFYENCIKP